MADPQFDARDWAKAWMRVYDSLPDERVDEAWMTSWFANALMRGFDEANARHARGEERRAGRQRELERLETQITYRGFAYNVRSQFGIDSLRRAIERNGDQ